MGQVRNIIEEWYSANPQKENLYIRMPALVLRWINNGQLRYADKSEILRTTWSPTITSTGNVTLPTDFLKEIEDRVKWDTNTVLTKMDYPTANTITWSGISHYSIWGETFYVWSASAGTPTIPYIQKPAAVAIANINTADFDTKFPSEFQYIIGEYLDAMFQRQTGDLVGYTALMKKFDDTANEHRYTYSLRRDGMPTTEANIL